MLNLKGLNGGGVFGGKLIFPIYEGSQERDSRTNMAGVFISKSPEYTVGFVPRTLSTHKRLAIPSNESFHTVEIRSVRSLQSHYPSCSKLAT